MELAEKFRCVKLDEETWLKAYNQASTNWRWWNDDFEHIGSFGEMPLFQDYPRFLGFGFDYSVFRGIPHKHLEQMQEWFRSQDDPKNFEALFARFNKFAAGKNFAGTYGKDTKEGKKEGEKKKEQNRVSLISKLLCLWRPEEYAMWDTYARNGLKKIHNNTRGHCYWRTNVEGYGVFRDDFFQLHDAVKDQILPPKTDTQSYPVSARFSFRVLDAYLMKSEKSTYGD